MADKMMRIAGRGDDGLAKAVNTDNEGSLKVVNKGFSPNISIYYRTALSTSNEFVSPPKTALDLITFDTSEKVLSGMLFAFYNNGGETDNFTITITHWEDPKGIGVATNNQVFSEACSVENGRIIKGNYRSYLIKPDCDIPLSKCITLRLRNESDTELKIRNLTRVGGV